MSATGPWAPLSVAEVAALFGDAPFRWWISGARALELHLGRSWREHDDTDVGVLRSELDAVHRHLAGWDLHVAAGGRVEPWDGRPLRAEAEENNVWCRSGPEAPWALDLPLSAGDDEAWVNRRDPSMRRPWPEAVLRSAEGVPYLAPELQLLFKSKAPRAKDHLDAAQAIPELDDERRAWLAEQLPREHPWHPLLTA